uniref:E3 ubiquitin-protein ligase RING1-like n=1 Tax=Anthurium amnicola TaxID=1678845 RepID=A0A1D1Z3B5_9ARAE
MAGMLPGVECARRRRFHQGGTVTEQPTGSRRSSFCLYRSGHESHHSASSAVPPAASVQRNVFNEISHSESLGNVAREARQRLDERLRAQMTSGIRRHNSTGSLRPSGSSTVGSHLKGVRSSSVLANLQREVFCPKGGASRRRFGWGKLGWKSSEQDDCVVCLEEFKAGDFLVHLPCAHRFHWRCVVPWLENNSHCPCCRMEIMAPPLV